MKVTLVPSSLAMDGLQNLTSFLINESVAIDAGSIGFWRTPQEQAAIKHVFISHTHADHIASLPILVENMYEGKPECVTIHGGPEVLQCLRDDVFNERVWPDFLKLSENNPAPFMKLSQLDLERPLVVEGLRITPIAVDHVVPTMGFVIQEIQTGTAVIIVSDTGPTERIWQVAQKTPNLKAIYLEACFPNSMAWLAKVSKHLTPEMFGVEAAKVTPNVRILAVHIKSRFREQVINELHALGMSNVEIAVSGIPYQF